MFKDLMNVYNRVKFHRYNIRGCQVKNFHSLACRFSIREMTKFGRFLGPFSPVYDPIFAEILTKSSSLDNKTLSHNFFKDSNFYGRVGLKVCTFGPTLTFRFPRN